MHQDGEKIPKMSGFIRFLPQSQRSLAAQERYASAAGKHHDLPGKRTRPHQTPLDLPVKRRPATRTPLRIASMPHAVAVPNQQRPVVSAAQLHRVLPVRHPPSKRHLTARRDHRPWHDGGGRGRHRCDTSKRRQVNHLVAFLTITPCGNCHHRPTDLTDK